MVALNWKLGLISLLIVVLAVLITRKVSLGSIVVAIAFPFECYFLEPDFLWLGIIMAAMVVIMHRSNIVRLYHGEEDNISFSKLKKKGE